MLLCQPVRRQLLKQFQQLKVVSVFCVELGCLTHFHCDSDYAISAESGYSARKQNKLHASIIACNNTCVNGSTGKICVLLKSGKPRDERTLKGEIWIDLFQKKDA